MPQARTERAKVHTLPTRASRRGAPEAGNRSAALDRSPVAMADDHVYRVIELVGTSEHSIEDAINSALSRAGKTLRNLRWFEVLRTSGHIVNGTVAHYQVTLKVGFTMEGAV